jgi:hypothetical protein
MFQTSIGDERLEYLTALASIGDVVSETLMRLTLSDDTLPTPNRSQAALGLGTIATKSSLATLWSYANDADKSLRESVITGLQIAGDAALRDGPAGDTNDEVPLLAVATGIHSAYADSIIRKDLLNPATSVAAAKAAGNRPDLVPLLASEARQLDADTQGDVVDSILKALNTTTSGRQELEALSSAGANPALAALASRRASLMR